MKKLEIYEDNAGGKYIIERSDGEITYAHHYWEDMENLYGDVQTWLDGFTCEDWDGNDEAAAADVENFWEDMELVAEHFKTSISEKKYEFQAANGDVAIEITGTYTDGSKDVSLIFGVFCADFDEIDQVDCIFEQLNDWGCVFASAKVAWACYHIAQSCLMDGDGTVAGILAEADAMDQTEAEEFCDWNDLEYTVEHEYKVQADFRREGCNSTVTYSFDAEGNAIEDGNGDCGAILTADAVPAAFARAIEGAKAELAQWADAHEVRVTVYVSDLTDGDADAIIEDVVLHG